MAFRDDVLGIKFRVEVLGFILQCIVFSGHGFHYMFLVFGSGFRKRGCLFWFYHWWLRIHVLVSNVSKGFRVFPCRLLLFMHLVLGVRDQGFGSRVRG